MPRAKKPPLPATADDAADATDDRLATRKRSRVFAMECEPRERAAGDEGPDLYDITFSSETPVLRRGFFGNWTEILGHGAGEVDTSYLDAGAAVLVDHLGDQVGVLHDAQIKSGKGRGAIEFSQNPRPQEIERDVKAKIRRFISVGYMVDKEQLVTKDEKNGDTYRVTRWTPIEVSVVSTPADITVGFGRNADGVVNPLGVGDGAAVIREEAKMKKVMENGRAVEVPDDDARPAIRSAEADAPFDRDKERAEIRKEEQERITAIRQAGAVNNVPDATIEDMLTRGLSTKEAYAEILKLRTTKGTVQPPSDPLKDMPDKDRRRWSLVRAIRIGACISANEKGDSTDEFGREKFDGAEREVHDHLRKSMPDNYVGHGGIMVPFRMPSTRELGLELRSHLNALAANGDAGAGHLLRTLSANVINKGAEAVFEQAGEFIELLRPQSAVLASGARLLTGLTGPLSFPKQSSALSAYWVGENPVADVTDSDIGLGLVLLAAKTLQASTGYTRQLLAQSSLDIEALVRSDFAAVHGLAIDKAAIHGKGNSGEPMGIYKTPGIGTTAMGGAPTFAKLIDQQTQVATASAAQGSLGYITTPGVAGTCRKTLEFPSAPGGNPIWEGSFYEGVVGGYPARATSNVSSTMTGTDAVGGTSHGGVFGNWADLLVGLFSSMELVVDIYRLKKRGIIEVTSFQLADVAARHPESFSGGTGLTP